MKNPRERKPRAKAAKPDKRSSGFIKKGKVWRTDRAQETSRGAPPRSSSRPRPDRAPKDEDGRLQARALAATGPGGYAKFSEIPAHKSGRSLRGELYRLANQLPDEERANLVARIKQAATTVTASLASGFGEGTFRSGVTRALESRGALLAVQDLLDLVLEQQMAGAETVEQLKRGVEQTVAAVNEYLGRLAKEREKNPC